MLALLAVVLSLPSLFNGYQVDDWMQQALLRQIEPIEVQRDVVAEFFTFFDGDVERNTMLRERGIVPWWTTLDMKARFWRPLAALTHLLDHKLAPGVPLLAHVHSIAWLAALVVMAGLFYRRIFDGPGGAALAGLAALIYVIDEGHGMPVGWIANRNALITGTLGLGAVLLHIRWRKQGWIAGAFLAPLLLGAALLGGESGIATTAWLFAWAVCLDQGPLRGRLLSLVPYAVVVVAWKATYMALGYGFTGSGLYFDPVAEPIHYLQGALTRIPMLLSDQFLGFPSTVVAFVERSTLAAALVLSLVGLALLTRALWRVLKGTPTARFWVVGLLLSALPVAATFPSSRLLTFVGIGGAGLVAEFLQRVWWRGDAEPPPGGNGSAHRWALGVRSWAVYLLFMHVLLAPLALAVNAYSLKVMGATMFDPCAEAFSYDEDVADKTVVFVNSNDLCVSYASYIRTVKGEPVPRSTQLLTSAIYQLRVEGIDEHTIDVHIPAGMQSSPADCLLRQPDNPLAVGETVEVPGIRYEAMSWNDEDLVDRVRVTFDVELWDPSLIWVCTRGRAPDEFVPPQPGETVVLKRAVDQ